MDGVGGLAQAELRLHGPVGVERNVQRAPSPARNAAGTSGGSTLIEIDARVGDLDLVLEGDQAAQERLLLRAPEPAVELQHRGIARDELRERAAVAGVIDEGAVGKPGAGSERGHAV